MHGVRLRTTEDQLMATYKIHGMDCAEEVAPLRRELKPLVGDLDRLGFDVLNGTVTITLTDRITDAQVRAAVARTGMRAEPWTSAKSDVGDRHRLQRTIATVISGAGVAAALGAQVWSHGTWRAAMDGDAFAASTPTIVASIIAIIAGSWQVLPKALSAARHLRPDMNVLMVIAVIGAAAIGEWVEGATVAFLFAVSLALESWSVGRARRAVEALLDLAPDIVRVRTPEGERDRAPADVAVGSIFIVRPGERIPLDGEVVAGESEVDQAPITGESRLVPKRLADIVYAGTINGSAVLQIRSTKPAGDTTLAHIIRLVGSASAKRARAEQWVDRFARIYTPTILALAVLISLVPPLLLGGTWSDWTYRALVLLVIGCPCALVISTPVTIVAGLAAAARQGILVKGGIHLEMPARLRAIAVDKTGTLTRGEPRVRQIVPMSGHDEHELLAIAAAIDAHSTHPLARAIVAHAANSGVAPAAADGVTALPGRGVQGSVSGVLHWLGSHRLLEERKQELPEVHERLQGLESQGNSVVVIGNDQHVCGFICLGDELRQEAVAAVAALHAAGIEHVVMLSGDNRGTAELIAKQAGVDAVEAELLPTDKVAAIERLVAKYGSVAMVGDGINDAPALARASLGIAMGAAGSDATIETADVALMSDDLAGVAWLIGHSRRTLVIIRQNVALALGIKLLFLGLAVVGHASLWAAIAADMGASLLVIFNGLRLLRTPGSQRVDQPAA
jgi:Cd2+/Zn2+-exporting ATPase